MIEDYSVYVLNEYERVMFYVVGYICLFIIAFLFYHSLIVASVSGVLVVKLRSYVEKILAKKRSTQLNLQFKDLLYSLSASVAAGRQMAEAIVEAEEALSSMYSSEDLIMIELRHMRINIVENKESDKVLLQDFAMRSHSEDIINFVQVYTTCRNMGGNLERIIGHTTNILIDKMNIEREIRVLTSQRKTEGRIISAMPIAMLSIMNLLSYSYIAPLYETIIGRLIMTGALVMIAIAIYLMEKISSVEV